MPIVPPLRTAPESKMHRILCYKTKCNARIFPLLLQRVFPTSNRLLHSVPCLQGHLRSDQLLNQKREAQPDCREVNIVKQLPWPIARTPQQAREKAEARESQRACEAPQKCDCF